jgi:hypothetical protein
MLFMAIARLVSTNVSDFATTVVEANMGCWVCLNACFCLMFWLLYCCIIKHLMTVLIFHIFLRNN